MAKESAKVLSELLEELKIKAAEELYQPMEQAKTVIREYRREKKISQEKFAKVAGMSLGCLKAIENGKPSVRLDNIQKALGAIGKKVYIK